MAGLARLCKMYGAIVVNGKRFVWDYATDEAVPDGDMPRGSDRWKASERAKWAAVERAARGGEG